MYVHEHTLLNSSSAVAELSMLEIAFWIKAFASASLPVMKLQLYLENIAVYSCYFIGQLQESILLRVH